MRINAAKAAYLKLIFLSRLIDHSCDGRFDKVYFARFELQASAFRIPGSGLWKFKPWSFSAAWTRGRLELYFGTWNLGFGTSPSRSSRDFPGAGIPSRPYILWSSTCYNHPAKQRLIYGKPRRKLPDPIELQHWTKMLRNNEAPRFSLPGLTNEFQPQPSRHWPSTRVEQPD